MKNLEEIRKKCEREIELAKFSNDFEEKTGIEPHVFDCLGKPHLSVEADNDTAGRILREYDATESFVVNEIAGTQKNPCRHFYRIRLHRDYRYKPNNHIEISFFHHDKKFNITIDVDNNDLLKPFFIDSERDLSDSELSTYKPTSRGRLLRKVTIPCKRFASTCTSYNGGYYVCTDILTINNIVKSLKCFEQ